MKHKIIYSIAIFALYFLTVSCEKVIDVNLNDANPKPVFEAYLENDSTCYVLATRTSSFYDNSLSPVISDAVITISDQLGNNETLVYQGDGTYRGSSLIGTIGNTYTLAISLDGNSYESTSTMPPLTPIDSFSLQLTSDFFGGGGGPGGGGGGPPKPKFWVFANYTDSADYSNYYAVKTTYWDSVEATYTTDYRIADDDLSDGISTRVFTTFKSFERGDTVTCEFASIDYPTWLYYKTLEDAISGAGFASAAPANPTNNISGGALGYFSAWSKSREVFVIP